MDVPSSLIVVHTRDFNLLEAYVDSWHMDVVQMEIYGLVGFGFFKKIEANRVVEFLHNGLVDFKLFDQVHIAHPAPTDPPPSPEFEPEERQEPEGKASSD